MEVTVGSVYCYSWYVFILQAMVEVGVSQLAKDVTASSTRLMSHPDAEASSHDGSRGGSILYRSDRV